MLVSVVRFSEPNMLRGSSCSEYGVSRNGRISWGSEMCGGYRKRPNFVPPGQFAGWVVQKRHSIFV